MANINVCLRKKKQAAELLQAQRWSDAKSVYLKIRKLDPRDTETLFLLGAVHGQLGEFEQSADCFQKLVKLTPDSPHARYNLGLALAGMGRLQAALESYQKAIDLQPNYPEAYNNLGLTLESLSEKKRAEEAYVRASQQNPSLPDPYYNLGNLRLGDGLAMEAAEYYEKALNVSHGFPKVYNNLAISMEAVGLQENAVAYLRKALDYQPSDDVVHSNLLFCLNTVCTDPQALFAEHKRWDAMHSDKSCFSQHPNSKDTARRLRVGYVSPDLKSHSVAWFIEPIFRHHNRDSVEIYCYSNARRSDDVTEKLKGLVEHWRDVSGQKDEVLAEQIRKDGIDILVDLAGHTANNRLKMFSAKPSPVQVTYCGYPNTTGLKAMDYRLTDSWADPVGMTDSWYTEQLVRLPHGFLCYQAGDTPTVAPLPAKVNDCITFGSFNTLRKVTDATIALWSRVLASVPNSRLMLKDDAFRETKACEKFQQVFAKHGIEAERLLLKARLPDIAGHLQLYGEVDIALDTFPYNGTTTTCEALWMGVPVLTQAGDFHAGRVGCSILTRIGLGEWIARDADDYLAKACHYAGDVAALSRLRVGLRQRIANSSLCDGLQFTQDVESAYRDMWKSWCVGRDQGCHDGTPA